MSDTKPLDPPQRRRKKGEPKLAAAVPRAEIAGVLKTMEATEADFPADWSDEQIAFAIGGRVGRRFGTRIG